jgi:galactokinase
MDALRDPVMSRNNQSTGGAKNHFLTLFHTPAVTISCAPGRAEILGCHTDYNHGFALSCAISQNTLCLLNKRTDRTITIASTSFEGKPVEFSLDNLSRDKKNTWTNYGRAVVRELIASGYHISGANILIDSTVPKSGGVSSSAALELSIAYGLLKLNNHPLDPLEIASLCRKAENSNLVNSPCGFLDQGTVALAKEGSMVLLDFLPRVDSPVSRVTSIPVNFGSRKLTFVIPVDMTLERQLGTSGYVVRRKMCEDSLLFWQKVLKRRISSLRDVTKREFEAYKKDLNTINSVMRKRVEHIIYENERVLAAVAALQNGNVETFGRLLTEGGKSSLELYELAENTPQLTLLVEYGRKLPGVIGMRNMGGGFSAIALALVENSALETFQKVLSREYRKKFRRTLDFIRFTPSRGAHILQ